MWKVTNSIFFIWISILAISDWKTKQIQKGFTWGGIVLMFILRILEEDTYFQNVEWILSLLPGVLFCFLSVFMRGKVGLGDGICMLGIGIALGLQQTIVCVLSACFITGIYAMGLVTRRENCTKIKIPFIPFLLGGAVISILH